MRKAKFKHLLVALMVCCTLPLFAGDEAINDLCSNAEPITCGDVIFGTTFGATFDGVGTCGPNDFVGPTNTNTGPGVWYSFSGTSGEVTFSTCDDASYDTKISVFSGSCETALVCIDGNDDRTGCAGFTSSVTVTTDAATSYLILVHGFGTQTGDFFLSASGVCNEPGDDNDDCADAEPIDCGETLSGSTVEATFDGADFCGTSNTGPGVWYSFTPDSDASVLATTSNPGTNYDTKLTVYSGSCGDLTCVGGDDDISFPSNASSEVLWNATSGTTYLILVHGFGPPPFDLPSVGDFELSLTCVIPEGNDLCTGAEPIECGETVSGTTSGATPDGAPTCGTSNTAPGVWYSFTPESNACVTASTDNPETNYDTKLTVYVGNCEAFACVGGNDDIDFPDNARSEVTWNATSGTTYLILVHGFGPPPFNLPSVGDFGLSLDCITLANDSPCGAEALTIGVAAAFDNSCASADAGEVSPGAGTGEDGSCNSQDGWCSFETGVQSSVWFTFEAPPSGAVLASAIALDFQIAIWEAELCFDYGSFSEIAANDDGGPGLSPAAVACGLTPGATYYVQVDGFGSTAGTGEVLVEALGTEPLSCDAGGCQTKFVGYEPMEGLNHLIATAAGGVGPYSYLWSGDGIVTDPAQAHISVDPTETTTYTVTITDDVGCTTECSVEVTYMDVRCGTNERKITVCHAPDGNPDNVQELCLGYAAVATHLDHENDILGFCGNGCLNTNPPPPPPPANHDFCEDAVEIGCGETVSGSTLDATEDAVPSCNFNSSTTGVWYSFTSEVDALVEITTCSAGTNFDTKLGVYTGGCGDPVCVAGNDDDFSCGFSFLRSRLEWLATAGTEYLIFVHGWSTSIGDFDLTLTCLAATRLSSNEGSVSDHERKLLTKVSLYPNPLSTSARIFVVPGKDADAVIDILDLNGRLIATLYDGAVTKGQTIDQEINSSLFGSNGIYMYRVTIGDETFVDKIVVNK